MSHVPLDQLLGMVVAIRIGLFDDYVVDKSSPMVIKNVYGPNSEESEFLLPLMSPVAKREGGVFGQVCGAFHYRIHKEPADETGSAYLALLPCMPKRSCEFATGGIKPLASVCAGKHLQGTGRYAHASARLFGGEYGGWIHHLQLLPLAMDLVNRFAEHAKRLPADLNWREDLHLIDAA